MRIAMMAVLGVGCWSCGASTIPELLARHEVPGASVAVVRGHEVTWARAYGVADRGTRAPLSPETQFQAASLSKSVSAVTVLSLVQDGVLSLDVDVNTYLTSWQVPDNALQTEEKVTLRRLLSHTGGTTVSGFRGYRYTERVPNLVQILDGEWPANSEPVRVAWAPGSEFHYSGGGYVIVTLVVEDVTGRPFPEVARERVLEPLGMSTSAYAVALPEPLRSAAPTGHYADGTPVPGGHHLYPEMAAGALWTTAADLARFLIEMQRSFRGESNRVLNRELTQVLLTEVKDNYSLGLNHWLDLTEPYFGHYGANDGFRSRMVAHRLDGHAAVVLTNSDNGHEFADEVIDLVRNQEAWGGP